MNVFLNIFIIVALLADFYLVYKAGYYGGRISVWKEVNPLLDELLKLTKDILEKSVNQMKEEVGKLEKEKEELLKKLATKGGGKNG